MAQATAMPPYKRPAPESCQSSSPKRLRTSTSPNDELIGHFKKVKVLGHGTFGVVWAAKDVENGQMVAMKQIKITDKEGFPRTALREIRIMSKAKHENVLSLNEVVWADKGDRVDAYIVMNLYDFDMRRVLDRMGVRFSAGEVKLLFLQLLRGVKYMHDNSLLHRDLKTENILLDLRGNLKICDFGLSRQSSPEGKHTPVVITLWYRPPELILGPVDYSREVDSWSLGCILGEIVRGSILFKGEKEADQLDKIFRILGSPTDETWPDFYCLPGLEVIQFNVGYTNSLRNHFQHTCLVDGNQQGYDLLKKLLCLDPRRRISARAALAHPYFSEEPYPVTHIAIDTKPEYLAYMDRKQREMIEQRNTTSSGERDNSIGPVSTGSRGYNLDCGQNAVNLNNGQPPHLSTYPNGGQVSYNNTTYYENGNHNGNSVTNDKRNSSSNGYPNHPQGNNNNYFPNSSATCGRPYLPQYYAPTTSYPVYAGYQNSYPFPPYISYPPPVGMAFPPQLQQHSTQQQHYQNLVHPQQYLGQSLHNARRDEKDGW